MLRAPMALSAISRASGALVGVLRRPRHVLWLLAWVPIGLLALKQIELMADFRVDDAYITFSFSKNLASGNGPIFSHGLRVEGYSNFLWMVLTAIGYLVAPHADPYLTARGFSLLALGFTAFAVYRLVRRSTANSLAPLLAVALTLSCSDLFRAAFSGLETAAFSAAIIGGWYAYLREPPHARRWSLYAFLPAALLRIDGFVPLFIALGFEVLSAFNERRFSIRGFLRWAAPPLGLLALYFAWRFAYYGLPLPATYYAKSLVKANDPERGIHQLWGFARDYGLFAFVPLALAPLFWGPRREAAALWTAIALQLAYVAHVGGDWMPFQRFFLPVVPLGAVLAGLGVDRLSRNLRALRGALAWPLRAGLVAALAFVAVHMYAGSVDSAEERDKLGEVAHTERHTRDNLLKNADLMRHVIRRPGERLVTDYAGVFSVMTDAHIIDQWGLCNADIALHGGISGINPIYGKECAPCYARLDPEYFHVVVPIVRGPNSFRGQREVIDAVFQGWAINRFVDLQHGFVVGRVLESGSGRTLWFLEKKRAGLSYAPRTPAPGLSVDYPFG
jgi:arabinofuranosyltransferase